jgi:hypothetical protein
MIPPDPDRQPGEALEPPDAGLAAVENPLDTEFRRVAAMIDAQALRLWTPRLHQPSFK